MDDIIKIPLTRGYVAIIDRADEALAAFRWNAKVDRNGRVYARRSVWTPDGKSATSLLHRDILRDECTGLHVDHIDGDGLNNRRANLRAVDPKINQRNLSGARSDGSSKLLGVGWHSRDQRWQARIRVDGGRIHLGFFSTVEEANAARLAAEVKYWGIQPRRAAAHPEGSAS